MNEPKERGIFTEGDVVFNKLQEQQPSASSYTIDLQDNIYKESPPYTQGQEVTLKPEFQGAKFVPVSEDRASKNDTKKVDLSLLPKTFLTEVAKAFMVGEKKYGRYNYTRGHDASQLMGAALRHLTAWNEGEDFDPEDGQHHLGAAGACIAMALRQIELGTLKDNRFKK